MTTHQSTPPPVEPSDLPTPGAKRWQMLRAGIQNLWEYDDQRFVFERGRLLLRGRNESGKTKAIEVLLPFLLDANLAPARLDPFGSTARSMRWNLINEDTPSSTNISVGYVWIEFGINTDLGPRYFTIGAGMRAKRSQTTVVPWFFTSELRVDRELALFNDRRVPLSSGNLKKALEGHGAVYETRAAYRAALVSQLFEMPSEQYDALIEALLQLRRPQLSKSLKPNELSRILSESLPPLAAEALEPLAEGFQRLDRLRGEREELMTTQDELKKFLRAYTRYIGVVAKLQARKVTQADSLYHRERSSLRERESAAAEIEAKRAEIEEELAALERDERTWRERQRTLETSEEYRAVKDLEEAERLADERRKAADRADEVLTQEQEAERRCRRDEEQAKDRSEAQAKIAAELRPQAHRHAEAAALLGEHRAVQELIDAHELRAARTTIQTAVKRRRDEIKALTKLTDTLEQRDRALHIADERLNDRQEAVRDAVEGLQTAEEAEAEAAEQLLEEAETWADAAHELALDDDAREQLRECEPLAMRELIHGAARPRFTALAQRRGTLNAELTKIAEERAGLVRKRDELADATHSPPQPPTWRPPRDPQRPGAPLFMLCDFRSDDTTLQGNIEAALQASGLLDAWVTPDGSLLDPANHDVVLSARPRSGATLFDELRPTPAGGVSEATVAGILRTVALTEGDVDAGDASCWISRDGSFGVGPLRGSWEKAAPDYVGATARELARARMIADLEARITDLEAETRALQEQLQDLQERTTKLSAELAAFPSTAAVAAAQSEVSSRHRTLVAARADHERAAERRQVAEAEAAGAKRALDLAASDLGLCAWIGRLGELGELTASYAQAVNELLLEATQLESLRGSWERAAKQHELAEARVESARTTAAEASSKATTADAKVQALKDIVGSTRDELLAQLQEARERLQTIQEELPSLRRAQSKIGEEVGKAKEAVLRAREAVTTTDAVREREGANFQAFARDDHLKLLGVEIGEGPDAWSWTETLRVAREVDSAKDKRPATDAERDLAENALTKRYQELVANLLESVRVTPSKERGVLVYRCAWNGRSRGIYELVRDVEGDIGERDELLSEEEHRLFESFLSGETHDHLRGRLRAANTLVEEMNLQLEDRPTASGMRLRLDWNVTPDTPPGTQQAIELMLRAGGLLTDDDRLALRRFLQRQLEDARDNDGQGTLLERMLRVLDYRAWFAFTIQYKREGERWKTLTRKAHGAGSGGQKAVMLHMPLFAAAAAFYRSAAPTAPRLIVLDEAFAGIDKTMRGQLMGLLAEFDLDFVMTSFEEWGFYKELDGLSTYQLSRERGFPGVYAERFLWDGARRHELGAS